MDKENEGNQVKDKKCPKILFYMNLNVIGGTREIMSEK